MAVLLFTLLSAAVAHSADHAVHKKALRAAPALVHQESFKRKLVACNTFPDEEAISITQNRKHRLEDNLKYKECRTIQGKVEEGDQLVFESKTSGTWTFQVGALPEADSTLLLVFEKRDDKSKVPSFQSFAFPASENDAQLAIIDAYKGTSERTKVHLSDAVTGHVRAEDLEYDRVYAIESGDYDLSMLMGLNSTSKGERMHMAKGSDYVALRLGGSGYSHEFKEELVTFALIDSSAPVAALCALFALFA